MANHTVIVDNNTWNNTHIATVGTAMSSPEKAGWEIFNSLDVKYVLVMFGGWFSSVAELNKTGLGKKLEIKEELNAELVTINNPYGDGCHVCLATRGILESGYTNEPEYQSRASRATKLTLGINSSTKSNGSYFERHYPLDVQSRQSTSDLSQLLQSPHLWSLN
ncbi:hypothetical protein Tco_0520949 [Tanacetum coccineum]